MADNTQPGGQDQGPGGQSHGSENQARCAITCAVCEELLMDALDGTLTEEDQAAFDLHLTHCAECELRMADAQRGAAWMDMLKSSPPQPSASLVNRILAQTSGQRVSTGIHALTQVAEARPQAFAAPQANLLPFLPRAVHPYSATSRLQSYLQIARNPRLAMTAAMAFFSIALTMNLVGIRVGSLRLADVQPTSIRRSFYRTNAQVVRYYDNLRLVNELQSRVRDVQADVQAEEDGLTPVSHEKVKQREPAAQPQKSPGKKSSDGVDGAGSSRKGSPVDRLLHDVAAVTTSSFEKNNAIKTAGCRYARLREVSA